MRVMGVRVSHEKRYNVTITPEQARFGVCPGRRQTDDLPTPLSFRGAP